MVLVTGATGLVGAHLVLNLLENNEQVRAIYRSEAAIEKTKSFFKLYDKEALFAAIEWVEADLNNIPALTLAFKNVDYVYHCAGYISFDPNDEEVLRKINIEGTANIVNFCLAFSVKKICFVSSIAALGNLKTNETTITEETEWNSELPHSDYAISKYGAEMEIWRGQQEGLPVVIINPGIIIGCGFWSSGSGFLFKKLSDGFPFYTKGSTGYVGIHDVITVMIERMKSNCIGERFIVVSDSYSHEYVLKKIAHALSVKAPYILVRPWMTSLFWRLDWLLSLFTRRKRKLSHGMANQLHQSSFYSNEKIKNQIGIHFHTIEECIELTASFYLKK